MPADTHEQRIGNMPHQTDDAPQTGSADESGHGSAKPTFAGAPAGWPTPDSSLLEDGRPVVPAFPLDALPQPWREWVSGTACGAGAPVDYVAQAVLGAVAGLCGAAVKACVTQSWSEPLVLWQALVGAPSAGKTPALDAIGRPLATVEKLLQRDSGAGAGPAQAVAGPVQGGKACPEQGRRVVVHDAALAALTRSVAARPPGVLLWRDEPTPWLYALARETSHGRPRGPFVDAWSAGSVLPVSVLCSLHPDGLVEALEGTPDGWAARFLFAWPGPPAQRGLSAGTPPREDEAVTMLHRIGVVIGTPERPLTLAFDGEAVKSVEHFLAWLQEEIRGTEGAEAAWLGKGRGTVVRLAAILALLDWSRHAAMARPPGTVRADHAQAATRLWRDYFRPHGRAVLDRCAPSDFERQVRRVVRWLKKAGARAETTREEVRRQALGKTVNAGQTGLVLRRLWGAGVLRPAAHDPLSQGGCPPQRWEINPGGALAG
jgi:Protein of unknown function (DUF3987)